MNESPHIRQSADQALLKVKVSDIAPDIVLCVAFGEIDLLTAPLLREKLAEKIETAPRHLVIDLSEIRFMASVGLQLLIELRSAQETAGRQLALVVGDNRVVTRLLQITGLDYEFDLHDDLTTAVKACRAAETVREP